jgi:DNA-3-methyladenine glycosylase II
MKRVAGPPRHRLIEPEADIRDGVRALRRKCAILRTVHDRTGDPPLRRRPAGFQGLARVIVGQQLSLASAEAIWARTATAVSPFQPEVLLGVDDAALRTAGLSAPKIRTLRAVAQAVVDSQVDLAGMAHMSQEEVHDALTHIHGIGPWTADIYSMFCLGHADAWAPGDLALQVATQRAFALAERPTRAELAALAERWRPWRGVAARLLWVYYRVTNDARSGAPL